MRTTRPSPIRNIKKNKSNGLLINGFMIDTPLTLFADSLRQQPPLERLDVLGKIALGAVVPGSVL